jgi:hypothetical protein
MAGVLTKLSLMNSIGGAPIGRPNVTKSFGDKEGEDEGIYKSPLSLVEMIRGISDIVSGSSRGLDSLSKDLGWGMGGPVSGHRNPINLGLTAIPGYDIQED